MSIVELQIDKIMKISYNWLKNYVDLDFSPEIVSDMLTNCGLEVESLEKIHSVKGGLEGVVIGEVKSKKKHPEADRLSCTTVDIGTEKLLHIVCGAPNVEVGQKVPVATVGTTLYMGDDSFQIKKSKIRGEISEGMICAEDELGLGTEHDGIMVLEKNTKIGTLAKEYFNIEEDYVFEIALTPNRVDAASHLGVARDLVAVINQQYPEKNLKLNIPTVENFKIENNDRHIDVIIEDEQACPRYTGITISGLEVNESPAWLKNKMHSIGLRPINNIVDITNFVLFETGQPLHAFDADKIKGDKVVIKKLANNTPFTTLDEKKRNLSSNDLMICNAYDGMCIAGVFGGIDSGVQMNTKNVFLESAYFDPKSIRRTSKLHGLQTDASFRFERGTDPNLTVYALKRAVLLFKELAGGKISSQIVDVYPKEIKPLNIEINFSRIDQVIGKVIDRKTIKNILENLGIKIIKELKNGLLLLIPTFKVDVTREADIIEEILRIYGYNNIDIHNNLKSSLPFTKENDNEKLQNIVSDYLSSNGFYEIINNSLTYSKYSEQNTVLNTENDVKILNPISQYLDVMRQSLLFGGLESIAYNKNHKNPDLKLYEFGSIYKKKHVKESLTYPLSKYNECKHLSLFITGNTNNESWYHSTQKSDFYILKHYTLNILKNLGLYNKKLEIKNETSDNFSYGQQIILNHKVIIELGSVSTKNLKKFDITQEVFYADFHWDQLIKNLETLSVRYNKITKYPEVRRDLALLLNQNINFTELEKAAFDTERNLLKSVSLFDIYEGDRIKEGKKSYALCFILQDKYQTLTDKVVDKVMKKLMKVYEDKFHAEIRK